MHDNWREIAQISGGILAYALITKVFDFIKWMRIDSKKPEKDDFRDIREQLEEILRLVLRIYDRGKIK